MSDRELSLYIVDILIAINKIQRYSQSFSNAVDFLHSELEWDASIRELQLIGDAINKLLKAGFLDKSYSRIVDFRNQIVHAYFGIDAEIVWSVIQNKLSQLNDDILLKVEENGVLLIPAIESTKIENSYNKIILSFLDNLQSQLVKID